MPVSRKNTGAQKCVTQRVKNSGDGRLGQIGGVHARHAEEVAHVVERHQDHDDAAHHVDRFEALARPGQRIAHNMEFNTLPGPA